MSNEEICAINALPLVLTAMETAEYLKIGRSKVYDLLRSNQIRSVRVGRQLRVPRQAVLEYLGIL